MRILNLTQKTLLASDARLADTPISRMTGLLNRTSLSEGEALIITRCSSIHMLFMRFPIDVVFVDKAGLVVGVVENIKPYQFSPVFWKADCAIELPVMTIEKTRTALGDQISY